MPPPDTRHLLRLTDVAKMLGVAALYALFIYVEHLLFGGRATVSSFEVSGGFALAVLLIGGKRYAWGVFLGGILINAMNYPLGTAVAISSGDALEAWGGAWLLTRGQRFDPAIRTLRDYLRLFLLGGVAAVSIATIAAVTALSLMGFIASGLFFQEMMQGWTGDMLGIILVTPLILICYQTKNDWVGARRVAEAALLLGLTFLAGQVIFMGWFHNADSLLQQLVKGYWMFLFIALVAYRLGSRGTVIAINLVAVQALLGAYQGTGFFADDIAQTQLVSYWCYTMILSIIGMALATHFSERKLTEQALLTSVASLRAILNNSPYMAWFKDAEGRYIKVNKPYVDYARLKDDKQIIGKNDFDLWPTELAEKYCAVDVEAMASRRQQHVEEMSLDGNMLRWVEIFKTPVIDERGNVLGTTGFAHDITERKQAEIALKKNEERFRLIMETIDEVFWMADVPIEKMLYISPGYERIWGRTIQSLYENPRSFIEAIHPEDKGLVLRNLEAEKNGLPFSHEYRVIRPDGSIRWVWDRGFPIRDGTGKVTHYAGVAQDISERKMIEAKIEHLSRAYRLLSRIDEAIVRVQDRNELFAAICNAAIESELFRFVWIGMLDEQGAAVRYAAYAGDESGYLDKLNIRFDDESARAGPTIKAILANTHVVSQDVAHDPSMAPWRDEALKRGYFSAGVFPIHGAEGIVGTINVYAGTPHFFAPDIIKLMLELASDISFSLGVFAEKERRELAENELRQLNIDLEHRIQERTHQLELVNRELEAFSYSVSHDLRAPLRSIDGFSQIVLKKYQDQLDESGRDYLTRVSRASQRMGHLIDDLLRLSQVTRGLMDREEIDLSMIAKNVAGDLLKINPERIVRFTIQPGLTAYADPGLLRIAMVNLLGNACKYTGKKQVAEIEFGMRESYGERTFFVGDNGAGFNMDYAHKLFGAFQRLHGANEFEGSGIGLATVQRIIHRHHGKVWADAKEGVGATFYFTLPQRERGAVECI